MTEPNGDFTFDYFDMPDQDFPTLYDEIDAGVITPDPVTSFVLVLMFLLIGWLIYRANQKDNAN